MRIPSYEDLTPEIFTGHTTVTSAGCWEWNGSRNDNGYGYGQFEVRQWLTHRASWTAHHGPIPPGVLVLHTCDNPPCCNPAHLFLGSHRDNYDDMIEKGRGNQWPGDARTKPRVRSLTHAQVLEIAQSSGSLADAAALYGCAQSTVSRIRNGSSKSKLTGINHGTRIDGRKLQLNRRSQLPLADRIAAKWRG